MKRAATAAAVLAAAVHLWATAVPAQDAEDTDSQPPLGVIVVDFQEALREADAARSVQRQLDGMREAYQETFFAIEEELRTAEAQLAEDRTTLSPAEFAERRRTFEQRVTDAQREAQTSRAALDRALERAMGTVRQRLVDVIAEMAREHGATIVLNKAQVILVDRSLDLTDDALARLNEALPTVDVTLDAD